jgi:hypothetical protein
MRPQVPGTPIAAGGEAGSLPAQAEQAAFPCSQPAKLAKASLGKSFELGLALPALFKPMNRDNFDRPLDPIAAHQCADLAG